MKYHPITEDSKKSEDGGTAKGISASQLAQISKALKPIFKIVPDILDKWASHSALVIASFLAGLET